MTDSVSPIRMALVRQLTSRQTSRIQCLSCAAGATRIEATLITAIAITERSARPKDARLIEWLVALPLRSGVFGPAARRLGLRISVGPFQMCGAPFGLKRSVVAALIRVRLNGLALRTPDSVARDWNGVMTDVRGTVRYSEVLRLALALVRTQEREALAITS